MKGENKWIQHKRMARRNSEKRNYISKLLDSRFLWGQGEPRPPLGEWGLAATFKAQQSITSVAATYWKSYQNHLINRSM